MREGMHRAAQLLSSGTLRIQLRSWRCWSNSVAELKRNESAAEVRRLTTDLAMRRISHQMGRGIIRLLQRSWSQWCAELTNSRLKNLAASHSSALANAAIREGINRAANLMSNGKLRKLQRAWRAWIRMVSLTQHSAERREFSFSCANHLLVSCHASTTLRSQIRAWRAWRSLISSSVQEQNKAQSVQKVLRSTAKRLSFSKIGRAWRALRATASAGRLDDALAANSEARARFAHVLLFRSVRSVFTRALAWNLARVWRTWLSVTMIAVSHALAEKTASQRAREAAADAARAATEAHDAERIAYRMDRLRTRCAHGGECLLHHDSVKCFVHLDQRSLSAFHYL